MTDIATATNTEVGGYKIDVPFEHQYDSKNAAEVSYYMYRRLFPLAEPTLALNGTAYSEFEIVPSQVFNLSKSYLDFDVNKVRPVGGTNFNFFHNGFIAPIDTLELTTAGGRQLVYLQNIPYMTKVMMRPTTGIDDFLANPVSRYAQAATTIDAVGGFRNGMFHKNDSVYAGGTDFLGAQLTSGAGGTVGNAADSIVGVSNWVAAATAAAADGSTAATSTLGVRYSIPLHQFAGSLLAVNKDLYFGQTIRLRITWNQGKFFGFESLGSPTAATQVAFATSPTITNTRLRLAIQANPISENAIKQRVLTEGVHLNVPYTHTFKYNYQIGVGDVSPTRKINKSHGQRLLRVFTAVFNPNGEASAGSIYCQNHNISDFMFSQVRSQLDGKNLQDSNLITKDGDLYTYLQDRLDKSVGGSLQQFLNSCYMLDDWTPWKSKDSKQGDTLVAGLSLAEERQYDITFTLKQLLGGAGENAAINTSLIYQFIVCQKLLSITKDGVIFE